ncbi:unnamed protein product, partial [Coregonus sp. 'balchen']
MHNGLVAPFSTTWGLGTLLLLLLWKKFTYRRRNKIQLIIELVWPLFLILFLISVRRSHPPYKQSQCECPSFSLLLTVLLQCKLPTSSAALKPVRLRISFLASDSQLYQARKQKTLSTLSGLPDNLVLQWQPDSLLWLSGPPRYYTETWREAKANKTFSNFLLTNGSLSPSALEQLLRARLNFQVVSLAGTGVMLKDIVCNDTVLSQFLTVDGEDSMAELQSQFCAIPADTFKFFTTLSTLSGLPDNIVLQWQPDSLLWLSGPPRYYTETWREARRLAKANKTSSNFLLTNGSLSPSALEQLLRARLNFQVVSLAGTGVMLKDIVCNDTVLSQFLTVDGEDSMAELQSQFCAIPADTFKFFTRDRLVTNAGDLQVISQAVTSMSKELAVLMNDLSSLSSFMELKSELRLLSPENRSALPRESFRAFSRIMRGHPEVGGKMIPSLNWYENNNNIPGQERHRGHRHEQG